MKITGIIAEYNPFHNGHAYQMEQIRRRNGKDSFIIVAMSGDFVQRGTPAIVDKYTRAKMALSAGADLVVELPALWATASAEYFAMAGVSLFHQMGCVDELCFGVETDDLSLLKQAAAVLCEEPEAYRAFLASYLKSGESFPLARAHAMTDYFCELSSDALPASFDPDTVFDLLASPNNILAIEYLKALKRLDSPITPAPLLREGAGYHDADISASFASATAIREFLLFNAVASDASDLTFNAATSNSSAFSSDNSTVNCFSADNSVTDCSAGCSGSGDRFAPLRAAMPSQAYGIFCNYLKESPVMTADDFSMLLGYELLKTPADGLAEYADCNLDIARRLKKNLSAYHSFTSFCEQNKSRDITYTRISRIFAHLLLDIRKADYDRAKQLQYVPYIRPLGFRRDSSALFSILKKNASIPLIGKLANAHTLLSSEALWLLQKDIFAADVYEQVLAQKKRTTPRSEYAREMILL